MNLEMKCFMMSISEKYMILEMQMIVFLVFPLKEACATSYGTEIKKDYVRFIPIHKTKLQPYQNALF